MKYSLAILFTIVSFSACIFSLYRFITAEPKFHLDDRVVVTRGFYKGAKGECVDLLPPPDFTYRYIVRLSTGERESFTEMELGLDKSPAKPQYILCYDKHGQPHYVCPEEKMVYKLQIVGNENKR